MYCLIRTIYDERKSTTPYYRIFHEEGFHDDEDDEDDHADKEDAGKEFNYYRSLHEIKYKNNILNIHILKMLYVSFTCLPSRKYNLPLILSSIEEQSLVPDVVIIQYPKKSIRLNTIYEPIDYLITSRTYKFTLKVNYTNDYGPITKLYPLLHMNLDDDDVIIIIDDDTKYNKFLFQCLYDNFKHETRQKCICMSGLLYPTSLNSQYYCTRPGNDTQLMEASFGYILKKSFICSELSNWVPVFESYSEVKENNWENSFLSDDFVFSKYLDHKNIKKKVALYHPSVNKHNVMMKSDCTSANALSSLGHNLDKYFLSLSELKLRKLV